jgi:hypothetical protein
MKDPETVPSL